MHVYRLRPSGLYDTCNVCLMCMGLLQGYIVSQIEAPSNGKDEGVGVNVNAKEKDGQVSPVMKRPPAATVPQDCGFSTEEDDPSNSASMWLANFSRNRKSQ